MGAAAAAWVRLRGYMAVWGCPPRVRSQARGGIVILISPSELKPAVKAGIAACGGYARLYWVKPEQIDAVRSTFIEATASWLAKSAKRWEGVRGS